MEHPEFTVAEKYDAIVVGAGGAGMCLLLAMQNCGWLQGRRVLVVEPEEKVENDRTWCFWAKGEDPIVQQMGGIATCSWDKALSGGRVQSLEPYRYYHLRSSDFYAFVKDLLADYPGVHWLAAHAGALSETEDAVRLEAAGRQYVAERAFDSRLSAAQLHTLKTDENMLWQSFFGWRVRLKQTQPEPDTVRLMDFNIAQDGATQFIYLLPTAANEALVELTRFGHDPIGMEQAELHLSHWTALHLGAYELLETETGQIPMSLSLNPANAFHAPDARVIPIGTSAGAVKATTGYAFHRMFSHAFALVEALEKRQAIPSPGSGKRFVFYDSLLLHLLRNRPELGKPILERLFRAVPLPKVLRFLDEKTHFATEVPMLLSLPIPAFLKALYNVYIRPARQPAPSALPETTAVKAGATSLVIAALLLLVQLWKPDILQRHGAALLMLGMVFPGIPHGALDHFTSPAGMYRGAALLRFIAGYISLMLLVVLSWAWSPLMTLSVFLLYSAWHFGETDLREWHAFKPLAAFIYGLSVLAVILGAHPAELQEYLRALGIQQHAALPESLCYGLAAAGMGTVLAIRMLLPAGSNFSWLQTLLILLAGVFLPLLPAFGLYFIGLHSLRGWYHLQQGLRQPALALFRKAMPFSSGAFALFALLLIIRQFQPLAFEGLMPAFFVFLAAISAPHIWFMHRFYRAQLQEKRPS